MHATPAELAEAFPREAAAAAAIVELLVDHGGTYAGDGDGGKVRDQLIALLPAEHQQQHRVTQALRLLTKLGALQVDRIEPDRMSSRAARYTLTDQALALVEPLQERAAFDKRSLRGERTVPRSGDGARGKVLAYLQEHGEVVDRKRKRAIDRLASSVRCTRSATAQAVYKLRNEGVVVTELWQRQTVRIALVGGVPVGHERPLQAAVAAEPDEAAQAQPEPVDEPLEPVQPIVVPEPDEPDLANAHDVALALLELVLARATQAMAPDHRVAFLTTELADAQHRLAAATEYSAKLRRSLGEASDELVATKEERNALRQRLASVERNLAELMKANGTQATSAFRDGVQHALNSLMREIPKAHA